MTGFVRPQFGVLLERLKEPRRFIQALVGPRQVGKTTLVRQVLDRIDIPYHFATADTPSTVTGDWIADQWAKGEKLLQDGRPAVLVLDEVQKIPQWSESVKRFWDEDAWHKRPLHVVLLGSSLSLIHAGLTESLAGRFELIRMPHWSFSEMREAFGWDLDHYIYHGGFPGNAGQTDDDARWREYVLGSLVEPTISRDILLLSRITKPALMRQLLGLACEHSGQILAYNKMLGQLQDFGNAATMAHYLDLLSGIGMVTGLKKFSLGIIRQRASSPKLQVWNTALMTAFSKHSFESARKDRVFWGRLVESAVGAHLLNAAWGSRTQVLYWADGNRELDFVLQRGDNVVGIEVKSGRMDREAIGLTAFRQRFPSSRSMLVGPDNPAIERALTSSIEDLLR